jgi:hypothetical protein
MKASTIAERNAAAREERDRRDAASEARAERLRAAASASRAKRIEGRRALDRARRDVRELREARERVVDDLGRAAAAVYRGEANEDAAREAEERLDGIEQTLRRAEAAERYLNIYS